jgi:hypothetical protein
MDLLEKALEVNATVLQIADNLALHEGPQHESDSLCDAARENRLTLEVGTRGLDPERRSRP